NPYGGYMDETEPIAYLEGMATYTDMLRAAGYACALSGKWHLGDSVHPQHGFEDWYTIGKGGCFYYHPDIVENGDISVKHGQYITDLIPDRACADISRLAREQSPFYLSVHYTAPHAPWDEAQHPKKWIEYYNECTFSSLPDVPDHPDMTTGPVYGTAKRRENLRGYFAAISAMDEGIGRILAQLESEGILNETMVVFCSDNGMSMGHHGIWGKGNGTFPMNMFDTAVKVPFLLRYPPMVAQPGKVSHALISACDIYPTLAELIGEKAPEGLPGMSFLPVIEGKTDDARENVVIYDEYGPVRMLRTREWKYVHRYPYGPHELYDLKRDPQENINRIDDPACQIRILEMRSQLQRFFLQYSDPAIDAAKEGVTGSGQLCRAGIYASRADVYAPIPQTRKEQTP
ncbi:MAG: sulfatase-like hydrolase/transferase, partial [Clostridia bacterium]|nr:sulfatase-like hydrolase/transferase [Clostridia bacterium]